MAAARICAFGFAVLSLLCAPESAHAERHATPKERVGINRAARQAYADQFFGVKVSGIEVSTVNRRWATAVVALFRRKEPHAAPAQQIQEMLYRTQRRWVAWFSTTMPNVEAPVAVERDLGLVGPGPLLGISSEAAVWIVLGVIVLALLSLGGSRGRDSDTGGPVKPPQAQSGSGRDFGPAVPRQVPCPGGCQNGRVACPNCGWARYVKDLDTGVYSPCPTCGCQLFTCPRCHGQGTVQA